LTGISLIGCIRRALDWGVDFIQVREKDLKERALYELTCRVVSLARGTQCRILVNGRADIALAAGAHGVHLPSAGLQISEIRPWLPENFVIGASVHTMGEIRRACAQKADYLLLGHVFFTESKSDCGPPLGLDYLRKVCAAVPLPVFGLGGMQPESVGPVTGSGAAGVAGISLFQNGADFTRLKKLMTEARIPSMTGSEAPRHAPRTSRRAR
jgi:thiamine-phosphate pyrophosphorylase